MASIEAISFYIQNVSRRLSITGYNIARINTSSISPTAVNTVKLLNAWATTITVIVTMLEEHDKPLFDLFHF
ncbi:hypothetical protein TAO_0006 [Candidatus Nitrosoglobus terrae]|uniref:Uncharacterized protein n=1 Tax=Candidatus Nitrosoglobus terrae TaxID=1630141 RepID=A0A1Q2SJS2_9GAMM|nr:hypothetical protein TAO_0006 [Candidatus Nitrosoglobus terrae]